MSYLKIVCRLVMIAMLVFVPAAIAGPALAAPATQGTMGKTKPPAPKPELLDINTATKEQLATLPGIGDAYAEKIIAGRPYKAKNELTQKKVIPDSVYKKIHSMIIAKQS